MQTANLIYEFSSEKNQQLIKERGVSFEEAIAALANNKLINTIAHPNANKYPNQLIYILEINNYIYLMPFVRKNESTVFLKTLFPSRKLTKHYLNK